MQCRGGDWPVLIHASCVSIGGHGVLLAGASGSGKSDLALRLIDRGAILVGDDYVDLTAGTGALVARVRDTIAGRIEARGLGILTMPHLPEATIALLVDLDAAPERLPDAGTRRLEGIAIPLLHLSAFEASAPLKVEHALARIAA